MARAKGRLIRVEQDHIQHDFNEPLLDLQIGLGIDRLHTPVQFEEYGPLRSLSKIKCSPLLPGSLFDFRIFEEPYEICPISPRGSKRLLASSV